MLDKVKDDDNRPLLSELDDRGKLDKIKRMLQEREKFYRTADITVESNNETPPGRIADEIIGGLFEKQRSEK